MTLRKRAVEKGEKRVVAIGRVNFQCQRRQRDDTTREARGKQCANMGVLNLNLLQPSVHTHCTVDSMTHRMKARTLKVAGFMVTDYQSYRTTFCQEF